MEVFNVEKNSDRNFFNKVFHGSFVSLAEMYEYFKHCSGEMAIACCGWVDISLSQ
jgi:hypothetical protein